MKTLQMTFNTDFDKTYQFNVTKPKENITAAEVRQVMQAIIEGRFFDTTNGTPVSIKSAKLIDRVETVLI